MRCQESVSGREKKRVRQKGVRAAHHKPEIVPVVPMMYVMIVAAHQRPRQRADVGMNVERPQAREHLHRIHEGNRHRHE